MNIRLVGLYIFIIIIILSVFQASVPVKGLKMIKGLGKEQITSKAGVYSEKGYYHIYIPVKNDDKYYLRYVQYDKSKLRVVNNIIFANLPGEILSNVYVSDQYVYVISKSKTANTLYIYPRSTVEQKVPKASRALEIAGPYTIIGIQYNGIDYIIISGLISFRVYSYDGVTLISRFYTDKERNTPVILARNSEGTLILYQIFDQQTNKYVLQYIKLEDIAESTEGSNITIHKLVSLDHPIIGYLQINSSTLIVSQAPTIDVIDLAKHRIINEIPVPEGDTLTTSPVSEEAVPPGYLFLGSSNGRIYAIGLDEYRSLSSFPIKVDAHNKGIEYIDTINFKEATDFYLIALSNDGYLLVYRKDIVSGNLLVKPALKKHITDNNGFKGIEVFDTDKEAIITSNNQIILLYREKGLEGNPNTRILFTVEMKPVINPTGNKVVATSSLLPLIIIAIVVVAVLGGAYFFFFRKQKTTEKKPAKKEEEEEIPEELKELEL